MESKHMEEPETRKMKTSSSTIPDWTKLPNELIQFITEKMNNCFDVIHARSVCTKWRSTFPFPSCLVRSSYSLPTYPVEKQGLCSIEKIPFVLFRVQSSTDDAAASGSKYFMGLVGRDESADYMEFPSPLQCTLRVKMKRTEPTLLMNMIGCQIFSLGHQYRMVSWDPKGVRAADRDAAILPLNKDGGGGEFVVLRSYCDTLLVLTSAERKWVPLMGVPSSSCTSLVTFRGSFYATFFDTDIYVIDPYSLVAKRLMPLTLKPVKGSYHLIPCGNDELFLVYRTAPYATPLRCKVSRLDEESGGWVEATDLGDRVLFVGQNANVCCSAKELPDGCGVTGNSILFTSRLDEGAYFFKYGPPKVAIGNMESDWRSSRETRVRYIKSQALVFRVEYVKP